MDKAAPRPFAGNLELTHLFACQNRILEEKGYSHGDLSDSNLLIGSDGAAYLIGLNNLVLHECGQTFVLDQGQIFCPWCGKTLLLPETGLTLKLTIKASGIRYRILLKSNQPIIIGKSNIASFARTVSRQHFQLELSGDQVTIRDLGRNGLQIWKRWPMADTDGSETRQIHLLPTRPYASCRCVSETGEVGRRVTIQDPIIRNRCAILVF